MKPQIFLLILAGMLLSSCGGTLPKVITEKSYVKQNIPIQEHPKPVMFPPVDWYVVSPKNQEEFMVRIEKDTGTPTYMAISPQGYENLAVGVADMRRYILQQKQIIKYYENAIDPPKDAPKEEAKKEEPKK